MSSSAFEVVLRPERTLRRLVSCSGTALMALGIALIAHMQISLAWRFLFVSLWLAVCLREQQQLRRGATRVCLLTLDSDGNITATDADGHRDELQLLSGSIVLPGVAWFRLRFSDGRRHAELFTRGYSGSLRWHRLQLLWQQAHEAFGHRPGP